jgi:hypothetical protein
MLLRGSEADQASGGRQADRATGGPLSGLRNRLGGKADAVRYAKTFLQLGVMETCQHRETAEGELAPEGTSHL